MLWLLMAAAMLYVRPPASLDELRLLAISWEMWQREVFLIPALNELAAPEQPPLLPWLVIVGWKIFGVNDWWPRLLPAIFSFGSLLLVSRVATLLWMDQIKMPRYVPFVLLASWLWIFYFTFALVDHLQTFFTLLGLYGILHAWRYTTRVGWFIYGFAIGCAVLASGLTSLLYTMPVALAGPIWAGREHALRWRNWYIDLATGLVFGVALVAMWGLVVTIEFGYGYAIDHLVGVLPENLKMFSADRPMYWYLVLIPIALLPWAAWPLVYSRAFRMMRRVPSIGFIFCAIWIVPVLIVLSVLGPRQPQYLLPILPAFALLIGYLLYNDDLIDHGEHRFVVSLMLPTLLVGLALTGAAYLPDQNWLPEQLRGISPIVGGAIALTALVVYGLPQAGVIGRVVIIIFGLLLAVAPNLPDKEFLPELLRELPVYVGIIIALIGVAITWMPSLTLDQRIARNAVFNMLLVIVALGYVYKDKTEYNQAINNAKYLEQVEVNGLPVAHVGMYQGQFHYYGRLRESYQELQPEEVAAWVQENPDGVVITYTNGWQPDSSQKAIAPEFESPFADTVLRVWSAKTLQSI